MNKIPLLLFAIDCQLFYKVDQTNCYKRNRLLDNFCNLSRQLINYHKSVLTFSKIVTTAHRQLVTGIFNINHSDSLGKYPGCPVFHKKPTRTTFHELINKATAKLEG